VKGNTNGFVLGLEKRLGAARVGVAVDHGTSDYTVRDATYPETLKPEAHASGAVRRMAGRRVQPRWRGLIRFRHGQNIAHHAHHPRHCQRAK
jgi:hypothetical protein